MIWSWPQSVDGQCEQQLGSGVRLKETEGPVWGGKGRAHGCGPFLFLNGFFGSSHRLDAETAVCRPVTSQGEGLMRIAVRQLQSTMDDPGLFNMAPAEAERNAELRPKWRTPATLIDLSDSEVDRLRRH